MVKSDRKKQWKGLIVLGIIWLFGAICDRIWFAIDRSVPAWDQAEYLRGTLNYWQAFQNPQWFDGEWWTSFWQLSTKVPPFTYIVAGIVQNIVTPGPDQATIVNLFFSAILLASVYGLGVELFSVEVGLWAAALCQLLPGLYRFRLDFLLDYPLTAIVTLSFYCLTVWRNSRTAETQRTQRREWFWAAAFGVSFGIALLVKQTAIFFLLMPLLWVGVDAVRSLIKSFRLRDKLGNSQLLYSLARVGQLAGALLLSILIFGPWYRINWLLILTSGKRATVDSAIAEGDPALNTLDAWTFYWKDLPYVISWPLLLVPIVGFILYFANSIIKKLDDNLEFNLVTSPVKWLAIFWISSYLLCSLNINKDTRYVMPYLPIFALFLAYGLTLWKGRWARHIRWGTIGLSILLMLLNIYPLGGSWLTQFLSPRFQHYAYMGDGWPHRNVIAEIIKTEPYLRSNLGVLPSTPDINQHNLNYYGSLNNFQVHGRQVGTRNKFVSQDARSLSWFVTKTGDQGSIPSEAQSKIVKIVEQGGNFQLQKSWVLPDRTNLNLYHSRIPPVTVSLIKEPIKKVRLNQVKIPDKSPPGLPIPVTYSWSGTWKELKSSLILLTWKKVCSEDFSPQCQEGGLKSSLRTDKWLHDRAIAMGNLHPGKNTSLDNESFEVIERTAMLPPANILPGIYTLEATYLNRETGEAYRISVPPIKLNIDPTAKPTPAPELDLITQLRNLAAKLPEGRKGLEPVFDEVGRINMYDPIQDYLVQADRILNYRLQKEPQNVEWAYAFALAKVLQKDVKGAIAALERVTKLDSQNPYAYAYLAFVHLYNWHPKLAAEALQPALAINPNIQELQALNGVAALMQGNFVRAWQILQQLEIKVD